MDPIYLFSEFDYENELHYELRLSRPDHYDHHARAAEARAFIVAITRYNFFKLDRVVARALERCGAPAGLEPLSFNPRPLADIQVRFWVYFELLAQWERPDGFSFTFEMHDDEFVELLETAQETQAVCSEKSALMALGVVTDAALTGPDRMLLDPTTVCNVDCLYCRSFSPLQPHKTLHTSGRRSHLDFETVQALLDQAEELEVRRISLVGGAEPTAVPYFDRLLQEFGRHRTEVDLSTNGTVLSRKRMELIVDSGAFVSITFSVSAASGDVYQRVHPSSGRLWPRLKENLRYLAQYKKEQKSTLPQTIFLFVIYRDNFHEVEAAVRLAAELGMDAVWFQLLHMEEWSGSLRLEPAQVEQLEESLVRARSMASDLGLEWQEFIEPQVKSLDTEDASWSSFTYMEGCLVGWIFSFISYQGGCHLCCGTREIGNLAEFGGDFTRLWRSDQYRFIRQHARFLNDRVNIRCANSRPLSGPYCLSCDNHNLNSEMVVLLKETGLHRYLDTGLSSVLIRPCPVNCLEVEIEESEGGEDLLQLNVQCRLEWPRVNLFVHIYFYIQAAGSHQRVLSETFIPIQWSPDDRIFSTRVQVDNFRLTSDGGVSIGAEVAYQEGALSRYYDQPRVEISLEPGTRPDRGGGLVPLEHSYRLEPTAPGGTSLEVLKPDRQPAEQFGQGEGCIIALSADLSQPVADPLVRLQLYRVLEGEDIFIFGTNNARHGVRPEVLQDGVRCQVDIPRLELMPGEYYFAASVMEGIGDQAVLFKRGATFRIGATEADPRPGGRPPILDFSYALDHLEDPGTPTA